MGCLIYLAMKRIHISWLTSLFLIIKKKCLRWNLQYNLGNSYKLDFIDKMGNGSILNLQRVKTIFNKTIKMLNYNLNLYIDLIEVNYTYIKNFT